MTDSYVEREFAHLTGKTIKTTRALTQDERARLFYGDYVWDRPDVIVLEFTDGTGVVVSADPEGNGPGFLFTLDAGLVWPGSDDE